MHEVDVFWSFRSPYSYIVTPRLMALAKRSNTNVTFRPVMPLLLRAPARFNGATPDAISYFARDMLREAERHGLPFQWPNPDPLDVHGLLELDSESDQERIYRLTRLGILAAEAGKGIEFALEVGKLTFGGVENWYDGDHLAKAAEQAGLDLAGLDETIRAEQNRLDEAIAANEAAQTKAGHWGVPLMVYRGEPFFGQDRFDSLLWRIIETETAAT
ncbi:MAG: DsbA family protein [Pseudomonadota bacterium]